MTALLDPRDRPQDPDELLEQFLVYAAERGLELYPAQEEAILELFAGNHVILNTPTGSGKSLVAAALHFLSAATGRTSVYTCPIKALVSEKFLALCREFGPDQVGMMTGDASVNRDAPILCCTAEILANIALRDGADARVDDVIMDEFHYYSDPERGVAWQAPLLTLPHARFLLMSATMSDTEFFADDITKRTDRRCVTVAGSERPVPLEFTYRSETLTETLDALNRAGKVPVYIVHFTQRAASETAQNLLSMTFCSKEEKAQIKEALKGVKFTSPFGKDIRKFMLNGIGLHHAGLLPKYRLLTEKLVQQGLLKAICGTDTLGVGVNVPIRTVLFTQLCKYDGSGTKILTVRDFHQIAGRAGRRGFDSVGHVVCLAPAHVVENQKLEAKALGDPKKRKKLVKKKPPERGYVHWDEQTWQRLQAAQPEALTSTFSVSHGMLLNVLSREGDGCTAMRELIDTCHNTPSSKTAMRHQGWQLFRALVDRDIIEINPPDSDRKLRVNLDLQDDFSLNQSLSLYALDTLALLEPEAPDYAYKVLSLVEAILENPDVILRQQLNKLKADTIAEMKEAGIEYEERMEKLEKLEHPKPDGEFIYATFNQFAAEHPWVGNDTIKPKSIAREMFATYASFGEYVKLYGLQRAEGLLLRHLTSVYRVLAHTIPPAAVTEAVDDAITYIEQMIRGTDSSLLDEWENLKNPDRVIADDEPEDDEDVDITSDRTQFIRLIRHQVFHFLSLLAYTDYDELAELFPLDDLFPGSEWQVRDLQNHMDQYHETHERIRLDPGARARHHTSIDESSDGQTWTITQTLVDSEDENDWQCVFELDIAEAKDTARVRLRPMAIEQI